MQRLLGQAFEQGYNAMDDRVENLLDAGVIDPAKVGSLPCLPMFPGRVVACCFCLWTEGAVLQQLAHAAEITPTGLTPSLTRCSLLR